MGKKVALYGFLVALLLAVVCCLWTLIAPFDGMIWIIFSTYSIIMCMQGRFNKLHIYIIALALGWIWAYAYLYGMQLLLQVGVSFPLAMFLAVLVVTFSIVIVHMIPLGKTPLNIAMLSLCFAPVMALFGTMGQTTPFWVKAVSGVVGVIIGCACIELTKILAPPKKKEE